MTQDETLAQIGHLLRTQDNRATDAPMFIVQERKRDYGYDCDFCDDEVWLDTENDYVEATPAEVKKLESGKMNGEQWQKTGYKDRWEFVTACFTEDGCKSFIEADGHNHGELRIYAAGSYRNHEFRFVRNFLKSISPVVKTDIDTLPKIE